MRYIFQGGDELFQVELKENKILLNGSLTSNRWAEFTERLFKPNREKMNKAKLLLLKWPRLTKEEREVYLVIEFNKMGYSFKSKI